MQMLPIYLKAPLPSGAYSCDPQTRKPSHNFYWESTIPRKRNAPGYFFHSINCIYFTTHYPFKKAIFEPRENEHKLSITG